MKWITLALMVLAGPANALSCMAPDVARSFQWAAEAEERYLVLLGEFAFEAPERQGLTNDPEEVEVTARFAGRGLSAQGFVPVPARDVTVVFACAGPWCGNLPPDREVLAFVEVTEAGQVLSVGPCAFEAFVEPSQTDLARVAACMRGEACDEVPFR